MSDDDGEQKEGEGLHAIVQELANRMPSIESELSTLRGRIEALERKRQMRATSVVAVVMLGLFVLSPIVGVGLLLYYMAVGL